MTHYITWVDFCTPHGQLLYDLPPPNSGCSHVGDLKHGRQEYDWDHPVYRQWAIANQEWWTKGREGPPPKSWRLLVNDKYAGYRICEDVSQAATEHNGYSRPVLWDGRLLYECLTESCPRLIQATHTAIEQNGRMGALRDLQGQLISVFRNEFKVMSQQAQWDMTLWPKATTWFEYSVELVSKWLLLHYEMYPLWWGPLIAQYCESSPQWEQHVAAAVEAAAIAEGRALAFTPRLKEPPT